MSQVARNNRSNSRWLALASMGILAASLLSLPALANPEGGAVVLGDAEISGEGTSVVTITQGTDRALIDWDSFSVKAGEKTQFLQPSAKSITANRVIGVDPSTIMGSLRANGQIVLVNRNGILFGKGSTVDAAGLVATTHDLDTTGFMGGAELRFNGGGRSDASVVNEGYISIRDAGMAAFVAPHVRNSGLIEANLGRVALGAGNGFTLDLYGDGLIRFEAGDKVTRTLTDADGTPLQALVENDGQISATGGRVLLTASAAREVVNQSVNISGIVQATSIASHEGTIILSGSGQVATEQGSLVSTAGTRGGTISVDGGSVSLGGQLDASATGGRKAGGTITVAAEGLLSLAGETVATSALGEGGTVTYEAGRIIENSDGLTDARGLTHGGRIAVDGGAQVGTSGTYLADGLYGRGGRIDITGQDVRLLSTGLSASGRVEGGLVRIGGAFQGGKTPDASKSYHDSFLGRWDDLAPIRSASQTFVNDAAWINVTSSGGQGGTAVIWSDDMTTFLGGVDARGVRGGGAVEVSSADFLRKAELDRIHVGNGDLLLDPKNLVIGDERDVQTWSFNSLIGLGYDVDITFLDTDDEFGHSVSLNAAGDRLAVGVIGNDGKGNLYSDTGAVFLFSFTDTNFSGGTLKGIIGKGYTTGGAYLGIPQLEAGDRFGSAVSLNAAGDRLAVGADGDDGASNLNPDAGAVYLFSFLGPNFQSPVLQATLGKGYTGGKDFGHSDNGFGESVSLNAAGDRLAVGAKNGVHLLSFTDTNFSGAQIEASIGPYYPGGGKNIIGDYGSRVSLNAAGDRLAIGTAGVELVSGVDVDEGRVHLFGFSDTNFSGGTLLATIGKGYTGGKNIDVDNLDAGDYFGSSVSLNAAGDRLAVGAIGDDGLGVRPNAGAVYLFSFRDDGDFTDGRLESIIGRDYTGGKNVPVYKLYNDDGFGVGVSLNGAGDRLAVGAYGDGPKNGAVYLFSAGTSGGPVPLTSADAYSDDPGDTVTVNAWEVARQLASGASVTLQASNDITVANEIAVTGTPSSIGALTLQAGRSILVDADITTKANGLGGDVTLIANDLLANGVVDAQRDPGDAVITMSSGTAIDAGPGAVTFALRDGAGKTHADSGNITLTDVTGSTITAANAGPTTGSSGIVLNGTLTASATSGDTIQLAGDTFTNTAGANALKVDADARWLVWSNSPAGDALDGLVYNFKQYDAVYGTSTAAQATGNGVLYELAPVLTAGLTGDVSKTYDRTTAATLAASNYGVSGAVFGDTVILNNPVSGTYDTKNFGTGKTVTVSGLSVANAVNGAAKVYGYKLASTSAAANIGEIKKASLTVTGLTADDKVYDTLTDASWTGGTLTGVLGTDVVSLDQIGASAAFADKNVGTDKTVTATGFDLSGADAGNYVLTQPTGLMADITAAMLTVTGLTADDKVYDTLTDASWTGGTLSGVLESETVLLDQSGASAAFADKNVGTDKTVTATGFGLSGADAGNYVLMQPTGLTADITAATLTVTGLTADDKVYDGLRVASWTGGSLSGVIGTETVVLNEAGASAAFADKNVGTDKTVTATGFDLSGADAGNYVLTQPTGLMADITAATLTVTVDDAVRTETEPNEAFTYSMTGFVAGEDKSLVSGMTVDTDATAASPPGTYRIHADGATAANYVFNYIDGVLTVTQDSSPNPNPGPNPRPGPNPNPWNMMDDTIVHATLDHSETGFASGSYNLVARPAAYPMYDLLIGGVLDAAEGSLFPSATGSEIDNRRLEEDANSMARQYGAAEGGEDEELQYEKVAPSVTVEGIYFVGQ